MASPSLWWKHNSNAIFLRSGSREIGKVADLRWVEKTGIQGYSFISAFNVNSNKQLKLFNKYNSDIGEKNW